MLQFEKLTSSGGALTFSWVISSLLIPLAAPSFCVPFNFLNSINSPFLKATFSSLVRLPTKSSTKSRIYNNHGGAIESKLSIYNRFSVQIINKKKSYNYLCHSLWFEARQQYSTTHHPGSLPKQEENWKR